MPRFQLMRGIHQEGGKTYYSGTEEDIINSASDLSKHNSLGIERFRPLPDESADEDDD